MIEYCLLHNPVHHDGYLEFTQGAYETQKKYCEQIDLPLMHKKMVNRLCEGHDGGFCDFFPATVRVVCVFVWFCDLQIERRGNLTPVI